MFQVTINLAVSPVTLITGDVREVFAFMTQYGAACEVKDIDPPCVTVLN